MCIPITINDLDFGDTELVGDELLRVVNRYACAVMDEAWHMDCFVTEGTSNGNSSRFQRCALSELSKKFGDGIKALRLPEIRSAAHRAGKRIGHFRGGMC